MTRVKVFVAAVERFDRVNSAKRSAQKIGVT